LTVSHLADRGASACCCAGASSLHKGLVTRLWLDFAAEAVLEGAARLAAALAADAGAGAADAAAAGAGTDAEAAWASGWTGACALAGNVDRPSHNETTAKTAVETVVKGRGCNKGTEAGRGIADAVLFPA
jgi:hypothetical protein